MVRVRTTFVAVLAAGLIAACGGSGQRAGTTPERSATSSREADGPETLDELVDRCGLPPGEARAPAALVPQGLLPAFARVSAATGSRAVVVVGLGLKDAYDALRANAVRGGLSIAREDFEGFEAELYLAGTDGTLLLALKPAPSCADGTRVAISRRA